MKLRRETVNRFETHFMAIASRQDEKSVPILTQAAARVP
jgi:hypothetical protein